MIVDRSRLMFPLLALTVAGSAPAISAQNQLPATGLVVGQPFPVRTFPSLDGGDPVSIADFRGKKVLLHIFASW